MHVCIVPTLFTPRDLFRCGFRVISLSLSPSLNVDDDDDEPSCLLSFPSHAATVCHDQPMHRMRLRRQRRRLPRVMLGGRRRRKNQHESDESHNFVSLSRVIPCLPHSFLPLPVLIIHSFALSLTHRVLLSFTLFQSLPSVYSISHHDMTAFSLFEFTNGRTDSPASHFGF